MALDYNPDREGHVQHEWIIQPGTTKPSDGIDVDGHKLRFGPEGHLRINDPKLANDIRQKYGREMVVTRVRHPSVSDRGHNYFFGQMPRLPWAKYDEFGKRIQEVNDGDKKEGSEEELDCGRDKIAGGASQGATCAHGSEDTEIQDQQGRQEGREVGSASETSADVIQDAQEVR